MALSGLPTGGPTLPSGANKVSLKQIDNTASNPNVDVTILGDTERKYANPPLKDVSNSATATCSASGYLTGSEPTVSDASVTSGWICDDSELVYEVGKHVTWSANWSYIPDIT